MMGLLGLVSGVLYYCRIYDGALGVEARNITMDMVQRGVCRRKFA